LKAPSVGSTDQSPVSAPIDPGPKDQTKILFLAPRPPYPPDKGDKIRSYHFLRHMASAGTVDIICCVDRSDPPNVVEELGKYCRRVHCEPCGRLGLLSAGLRAILRSEPVTVARVLRRGIYRTMDQWMKDTAYDLIFAYTSATGPYCETGSGVPLVVDFVDCDSAKWIALGEQSRGLRRWIYRREGHGLRNWEQRLLRSKACAVAITETEARLLRGGDSAGEVTVIPNGVDMARWQPVARNRRDFCKPRTTALWVGGLFYKPYADAIQWFLNQVWPRVRKRVPTAGFTAIGADPPRLLRRFHGRDGVRIAGYRPSLDADMIEAAVGVVPLLIAPGLQNKILDFMAAGVPVVATRVAVDGTNAMPDEHVLVCDDSEGFAEAMVRLLKDPPFGQAMADRAWAWVSRTYSWERVFGSLDNVLGGIVMRSGSVKRW